MVVHPEVDPNDLVGNSASYETSRTIAVLSAMMVVEKPS